MISVLMRPQYQGFRNRWRRTPTAEKKRGQDILVILLSVVTAAATFGGTRWALRHMSSLPFLVYVPPSLPLGLMLLILFVMVSMSSLVSAIGIFYHSEDLELWLASPIHPAHFFSTKLFSQLLSVSWMPLSFLFPLLAAFAIHYHAPWWFYFAALAALIPYFAIPACVAALIAILLMRVIDPRWNKVIAVLILGTVLFGLYTVVDVAISAASRLNDGAYTLRLATFLTSANSAWSPSTWTGTILSELLLPAGKNVVDYYILLFSTTVGFFSLGYAAFFVLYPVGYTRACHSHLRQLRTERKAGLNHRLLSPHAAIWLKEIRSIVRDVSQSSQLLLLGFMCLLYMTNVKFLLSVDAFPEESRSYWRNLLFVFHSSVAAFFTVALATRLVFSSVSREGRAFWLLRTAPISLPTVLRAKLWFWFPPIAVLSALIFSLGAYAVSQRFDITVIHLVCSGFISFGIVGVGIGLGAFFAEFTWDHPSHLALGLGSFIYMLVSVMLVFLNMVPTWFILQISPSEELNIMEFMKSGGLVVTLALCVVAAINISAARAALALGTRAIIKEEK